MRLVFLYALLLPACSTPSTSKDAGDDTGCADADRGTWYRDGDGDGFGDPDAPVEACAQPEGTVIDATDCDDDAAAVYPGAEEIWYDGADEDCSGGSDFDQDGDGYERDEECDDLDPTRYPDPTVEETWYDGVDQDCDGNDGDRDGDGWYVAGYPFEVPAGFLPGDCADDPAGEFEALNGHPDIPDGAVHPDAVDLPYDGIDANCDGRDDFDADADGFRTDAWPDAAGAYGADCDDADPDWHPGAPDDWYDGLDHDCRGNDDFDQDYDGVGVDAGDCDDEDAGRRPGAVEDCGDGEDNDCDGSLNGANMSRCSNWYADGDGDGFGGPSICACVGEGDYTASTGDDCDDADPYAFPGAPELCDGVRNDCDDRSWNDTYEDGTVSHEGATGAWSDLTASWIGASSPVATPTLPDSGTVYVCRGRWAVSASGPSGSGTVEVVGRHGAAATVLNAGGEGPVLTVSGSGVTVGLEGLTLSGGLATYGGGVYGTDASVTLTDCVVEDNEATYGAGLYADGGSLVLDGTSVSSNYATVAGGGVYAIDADVSLSYGDVSYNDVESGSNAGGGGLLFTTTTARDLSVVGTRFQSNFVVAAGTYGQGGAVYVSSTGGGDVSVASASIEYNAAYAGTHGYGGGLRLETGGATTASVTDLALTSNVASGSTLAYGGGVYAYQASSAELRFERITAVGNVLYSTNPAGGGMNVAAASGGDVVVSGSTVSSNSTYNTTGTRVSGAGGGLYVSTLAPTILVETSSVTTNDAGSGDGILVATSGGSTFEVRESEVASNSTTGIMHYAYDTASRVVLTDSRVYDHSSYGVYLVASTGYAAQLECVGSSALTAGVYDNGVYGIAGSCTAGGGNCYIFATTCDLGAEGADADNGYADLAIDSYALDGWGDDATFSCVNALCR